MIKRVTFRWADRIRISLTNVGNRMEVELNGKRVLPGTLTPLKRGSLQFDVATVRCWQGWRTGWLTGMAADLACCCRQQQTRSAHMGDMHVFSACAVKPSVFCLCLPVSCSEERAHRSQLCSRGSESWSPSRTCSTPVPSLDGSTRGSH